MKLTITQYRNDPGFQPWTVDFDAPGGTLGRSADNHLALPDDHHDICRVQAALRISNDACYLVNLSSMSSVSINGRPLARSQEAPLAHGDELAIGPYTIKASIPDAAAASIATAAATWHDPSQDFSQDPSNDPLLADAPPQAEPDALLASSPTPEPAEQAEPVDVFGDLFGPGTLPVGSAPDMSVHPFDLESAQNRNPADPLQQLPRRDAHVPGNARDPLDMLGAPDAHDVHSVFSDTTPSTLPSSDPLAAHRSNPITEALGPRRDTTGSTPRK